MPESSYNSSLKSQVSLELEISGDPPVLTLVTFKEQGKEGKLSLLPSKKITTKAIATALVIFRTYSNNSFFRITSKREGQTLVSLIVGAIREIKNNSAARCGHKGKIYSFAEGQFINLFVSPTCDTDCSYVDLNLKRLKPSSVSIIKDN